MASLSLALDLALGAQILLTKCTFNLPVWVPPLSLATEVSISFYAPLPCCILPWQFYVGNTQSLQSPTVFSSLLVFEPYADVHEVSTDLSAFQETGACHNCHLVSYR